MALRDWLAPTADMAEATNRLKKLGAVFAVIALLLIPLSLSVPLWLQGMLAPSVRQLGLFAALVFGLVAAAIVWASKFIASRY